MFIRLSPLSKSIKRGCDQNSGLFRFSTLIFDGSRAIPFEKRELTAKKRRFNAIDGKLGKTNHKRRDLDG
jgi:hypothetical protein